MHRMGGKSRAAGQDKTLASMDPSGYFLSFYLWIYLSSVFYYILSYRAGIDTRRPARGNVAYLSIDGPTHIMPPSLVFQRYDSCWWWSSIWPAVAARVPAVCHHWSDWFALYLVDRVWSLHTQPDKRKGMKSQEIKKEREMYISIVRMYPTVHSALPLFALSLSCSCSIVPSFSFVVAPREWGGNNSFVVSLSSAFTHTVPPIIRWKKKNSPHHKTETERIKEMSRGYRLPAVWGGRAHLAIDLQGHISELRWPR